GRPADGLHGPLASALHRAPRCATVRAPARGRSTFSRGNDTTMRRLSVVMGPLAGSWLSAGCSSATIVVGGVPPGPLSTAAPKPAATAAAAADGGGYKVFDPKNPPADWVNCHNNHCHHENGQVASYAQVMKEMGATSMKGGAA